MIKASAWYGHTGADIQWYAHNGAPIHWCGHNEVSNTQLILTDRLLDIQIYTHTDILIDKHTDKRWLSRQTGCIS